MWDGGEEDGCSMVWRDASTDFLRQGGGTDDRDLVFCRCYILPGAGDCWVQCPHSHTTRMRVRLEEQTVTWGKSKKVIKKNTVKGIVRPDEISLKVIPFHWIGPG
jgi:hypothetical protein